MMAKFKLRPDGLAEYRRRAGIDTNKALAGRIGMTEGQVSRVLRGDDPGTKFVAGVLLLFGTDAFDDLFEVVPK